MRNRSTMIVRKRSTLRARWPRSTSIRRMRPPTGQTLQGSAIRGPGVDDQVYNDLWFSWTAAADGLALMEIFSLNPGGRAAIYEATCPAPAGAVVACLDLPSIITGGTGR